MILHRKPTSPFRILVVDDDQGTLDLIHDYFTRENYEVCVALGGTQALEIFALAPYDLVITDLKMPQMSGIQFIQALRQIDMSCPVIVMSGFDQRESVMELLQHGAQDFLQKPILMSELLFSIKRIEERAQLARENAALIKERKKRNQELIDTLNASLKDKVEEITHQFSNLIISHSEELTDDQVEQIESLRATSIFQDLSPIDLRLVARELSPDHIDANQDLITQGQRVSHVVIIREGIVDILVNDDRVTQRGPMDSVGEMSCLSGEEKASATVRTITSCEVWKISREAFLTIVDSISPLRSKMFFVLTNRLQTISHRFSEILKHVPHGIVKIDPDGIITEEFSSRCVEYLGITPLARRNLGELLFQHDNNLLNRWNQVLQSIKQETEFDLGPKIALLPTEISYLHPHGDQRVFKLFYHVSLNPAQQVNGLDIGIEDITHSRIVQNELLLFQNILTGMEQLLILFEAQSGIILQETLTNSKLGQLHFPYWKRLKKRSILTTILGHQDSEQLDHMKRWLRMLEDPFCTETMSAAELSELAPTFVFESIQGTATVLSFSTHPDKKGSFLQVLGQFKFTKDETPPPSEQNTTVKLMEEVMNAERKHQSGLSEVMAEMQITLELLQSQMATPIAFAKNQRAIAGKIHSIKGLGQSFGLTSIANASHMTEELLQEAIKKGQSPSVTHRLVESLNALMALVVVSKSLCDPEKQLDLGIPRAREPEITMSLTRFERLKAKLLQLTNEEELNSIHPWSREAIASLKNDFFSLDHMPLSSVFKRLRQIIEDSAKLLNKQTEVFIHQSQEIHVPIRVGHTLNSCIIQLVKNAIYHGIETTNDRLFLQKHHPAMIELVFTQENDQLSIWVRDNGKGFNCQKILEKAIQMGIIDSTAAREIEEKGESAVFQLVFTPGFSTAGSVSLLSGRGVGMDLIKMEIEALGGSVSLESTEGIGSAITLRLPVSANGIITVDPTPHQPHSS